MMTCLAVCAATRPKACVLTSLVDLSGCVKGDLGGRGDHVVDDLFLHIHLHVVVLDLDEDVVGVAVLVLLIRGDERLRDLLDHIRLRDAAFFFKLGKRCKNFGVHVFLYSSSLKIDVKPHLCELRFFKSI